QSRAAPPPEAAAQASRDRQADRRRAARGPHHHPDPPLLERPRHRQARSGAGQGQEAARQARDGGRARLAARQGEADAGKGLSLRSGAGVRLSDTDIESLERAIVASVAPERAVEIAGWLVPLDPGAIGRARSAVPLAHDADPGVVGDIEQIYLAARLPPAFRI